MRFLSLKLTEKEQTLKNFRLGTFALSAFMWVGLARMRLISQMYVLYGNAFLGALGDELRLCLLVHKVPGQI